MPNPGADRPLRKVTLNLYEEDCAWLEQEIGHGWSEWVRDVVHDRSTALLPRDQRIIPRKLGDLDDNR